MNANATQAAMPVSFLQPEVQRDPLPFVHRLLAGPRVHVDPLSGIPMVTRFRDITAVLADTARFSNRNPLVFARTQSPVADEVHRRLKERGFLPVDTLVTNDPPSHTRYRALVDKVFAPTIVRMLEARIAAIADELVDDLAGRDRVELVADFAMKLPLYFISEQLGVPRADAAKIKFWSDISIERINPAIPPERELELTEHVIDLQQYMWARSQEAAATHAETLLGHLVRAEIDGVRLNPEELMNVTMQFFVAGHETTTAVIGHALRLLLEDDALRARLAAAPALVPAFVEEALRLHPPVGGLRLATADTELHGVPVRKGSMVSLSYICGNHDPEEFPDPEVVNLERRNLRNHLSFGRGIHYCIGNLVARAEARIAIERVLARLPGLRLDGDAPAPCYAALYHSHCLERLHARV